MPEFVWEATTRSGELRKGIIEASDAESVKTKLRAQQLQPTKVKKKPKEISITIGKPVKGKDLVVFTRQFSTMIDAGLPLVQCLDILGSQTTNRAFQKIIYDVKGSVEAGATFADALKKHPKVFDDLFVNLVAAGEVGGILDTILNRLSAYIEKAEKLKSKVKKSMIYPAMVMFVAILVITVLLVFVIPKFKEMFADFGGAVLPAPTQMVLSLSAWFRANLPLMAGMVIGLIIIIVVLKRHPKTKELFDRIILKLPLFGTLFTKIAVAKFTRTMGTMLSSGVPIIDALEIVSKTAGNKVIEKAMLYTKDKIGEGKNLADPMRDTKIFPSMVVQMVAVGESTGALDSMLTKIADFYEDEVDTAVDAMTSMIEPFMMVFLGGIVGFFLVAMYLPIFRLAKNV
jgi:type IV pilus assembly protein PilC